ncbi:hypothetical protein GIB67_031275 [Kingdonia uniflora]|uniref:Histone-lysine N-methyltransferase SUVR3 n=1 Tax=Kingdonia uniflora TaxID=39325 RepID=A0A7J7P5Q1_9MAGN|nr:hypothetical protein GIB67_031275 [Kingdonia uniflora]
MSLPEAKKSSSSDQQSLLQCADLILPWLSSSDLASISLTSKTLYSVSKFITITRTLDASRGLEKHGMIPFVNNVDSQRYNYFIYTCSQIVSNVPVVQQWGGLVGLDSCFKVNPQNPILDSYKLNAGNPISDSSKLNQKNPISTSSKLSFSEYISGCDCNNCSDEDLECPCSILKPGFLSEMMTECGPSCTCEIGCDCRLTQQGVSVQLRIVKDRRKGWGLYAAQFVRLGEFVCEYAGEVVTTGEARIRQRKYDKLASDGQFSSALLIVREHLPSGKACLRMNIDATRVGNVARFINHSCDGGNLATVLVRNSGSLLPRLCFFASRDIKEGEELAFSYGDVRERPDGLQCFCGSSSCFGLLPSEKT